MKKILVLSLVLLVASPTASYAGFWDKVMGRLQSLFSSHRDTRQKQQISAEEAARRREDAQRRWDQAEQKRKARDEFVKNIDEKKSDSLKTLDRNTIQLSADLEALHVRMSKIEQVLRVSGTMLKVPGLAHTQLKLLEASMTTADSMVKTAEAVPQTRDKAKTVGQQTGPALQKVKAARESVGSIAVKTDPLAVKVLKAQKRLKQADEVLVAFNELAVKPAPFATFIAQECINGAATDRQECMRDKVNTRAEDLNKAVVELDRVVKLLLTDLEPIEASLPAFPTIDAKMQLLADYQKLIDPIVTNLDNFVGPLRSLESLLNASFTVSFPYPDTLWSTKNYDLKIGMRTIIEGSSAIQSTMEDILSWVLWQAAKAVGVDSLINSLIDQAKQPLNAVLDKLNLDVNIDLGDIGAITGLAAQIESPLGQLDAINFDAKIPALDASLPGFGLPGLAADFDAKKIDPRWFNPNNFDLVDTPVVPCRQGSYLCGDVADASGGTKP